MITYENLSKKMTKIENEVAKAKGKYYTPEMEEFHHGFEYEIKLHDSKYYPRILGRDPILVPELQQYEGELMKLAHADVRVKFLDREDIEKILSDRDKTHGEKWKPGRNSALWGEFVMQDATSIIFSARLGKVLIEKTFPDGRGKAVVFNGTIKNKSELKRVLKQVGVTS